ncbi:glycosyltransferase family A protein [Pararhizobium antarcticum]|uniref:glycosyltransferase family A protein n=1 Tax=Pararhizobium antarcticum TaxID=1798805 RepID=UPI000ABBAFF2|nr:glycosyltransferase family A protein [Pararhizobium antarcticum]
MFYAFRRNPRERLRSLPVIGKVTAMLFERADRNGWLSDIISDPQVLWGRSRLFRFFSQPWEAVGSTPIVTIVVASRNNEATLRKAVCSLLNQTLHNIEVIIVDDHSTDGSVHVARDLIMTDSRVRLLINKSRLGTGSSRNNGMKVARGEYITFQDGDDTSEPSRLEVQYKSFLKYPSKELVTCNYVRVNENGDVIYINNKRTMRCIISMMFRREKILSEVGYFRDESVSEDSDYYERIKIAFGASCDLLVFRTLYKALFRSDSSFFGTTKIIQISRENVNFDRYPSTLSRWRELQLEHFEMKAGRLSHYVPLVHEEQCSELSRTQAAAGKS